MAHLGWVTFLCARRFWQVEGQVEELTGRFERLHPDSPDGTGSKGGKKAKLIDLLRGEIHDVMKAAQAVAVKTEKLQEPKSNIDARAVAALKETSED